MLSEKNPMALVRLDDPRPPASEPPSGFALFNLGFRPFFLASGIVAVVLVLEWVAVMTGAVELPRYYGQVLWHAHEMVYGYSVGVIAGFLLTAGSNWVGRPLLKGAPLAALFLLWCAGRLLPLLLSGELVALVDLLFLPLLALIMLGPIVRLRQWRNIAFPVALLFMALGNAMVHAEALGWIEGSGRPGILLGLYVVVVIIALMGGRVIPFFVERGAEGAVVRKWRWLEAASIVAIVFVAVVEVVAPEARIATLAALVAALLHGLRLWGWSSRPALRVPLLWVLLYGYGWLVAGLALVALSKVTQVPASLALHAFTVGAIGVLTVGMMARVSLGHTGRPLRPHALMSWSFALLNLAVVARVLLPLTGMVPYPSTVALAALLWVAGFAIFLVIYTPILIRPRIDGRPG